MKNILSKCLLILSISLFFSCDRELEYGSDYEFKINNIDNNSIIINSPKTFSLELTTFFNPGNNKTFKFSYEADNIDIINDNITLLKSVDYNFTFDELNKLPLTLTASKEGNFTLTIKLTDAYGIKKEQKVIVKVEENLNYSVVANNMEPLYEKVITNPFEFSLNLTNIGTSEDTYQIKAISSLTGTVLINSKLAENDVLYPVTVGNISVSFTPEMLDVQTLTIVVVNSENLEKEVTFNLKVLPKVFSVSPVSTFSVKKSLIKDFSFATVNTIPTWKYQVKFSSTTNAKIYTEEGTFIPLNSLIDLPINKNTFNYKYSSDAVGEDNLTITVIDKNGQTVSSSVVVNVLSIPTIDFVIAKLSQQNRRVLCNYEIGGAKAYGNGVTIAEYEFSIFNFKTKVNDVYTLQAAQIYTSAVQAFYFDTDPDATRPTTPNVNESKLVNWYYQQPYTVRVKDSEGVWSETIKGVMTY